MSAENLIANIDLVRYPRDSGVLLARSKEVVSIGLILTPYEKTLVAAFSRDIEELSLYSIQTLRLASSISVYISTGESDAMSFATHLINQWFIDHSDEGELARRLVEDDFTEVVKDAKPNEAYMNRLGGDPLDLSEQLIRGQKLGKVRDRGIVVPLRDIVDPLRNVLV